MSAMTELWAMLSLGGLGGTELMVIGGGVGIVVLVVKTGAVDGGTLTNEFEKELQDPVGARLAGNTSKPILSQCLSSE